eukprot:365280-Chlamydomonas_euryale.AAC.5
MTRSPQLHNNGGPRRVQLPPLALRGVFCLGTHTPKARSLWTDHSSNSHAPITRAMAMPPSLKQWPCPHHSSNGPMPPSLKQWPNGPITRAMAQCPHHSSNGPMAPSLKQWPNGPITQAMAQWPHHSSNGPMPPSLEQEPNAPITRARAQWPHHSSKSPMAPSLKQWPNAPAASPRDSALQEAAALRAQLDDARGRSYSLEARAQASFLRAYVEAGLNFHTQPRVEVQHRFRDDRIRVAPIVAFCKQKATKPFELQRCSKQTSR